MWFVCLTEAIRLQPSLANADDAREGEDGMMGEGRMIAMDYGLN